MAALWEPSHVQMGDKEPNVVQRGISSYCLPTHTVPAQEPSLSCVIIPWLNCLFTVNFFCHRHTNYIHMDAKECNHVTGEFPQALLINSKLASSCIWKTSVESLNQNTSIVYFSHGRLTGLQVSADSCVHIITIIHRMDKITWAPDAMLYVIQHNFWCGHSRVNERQIVKCCVHLGRKISPSAVYSLLPLTFY